jgi:phosphoribosylformimino-5-aminoimidazole carboxamide ribotide isomerase
MRIIPVIDLLDGRTVHAVKGERKNYKPLRSLLCDTPDPAAIARAFRDQLGLNEIYVADLNAIQSPQATSHRHLITALARTEKINLMLDAGISEVTEAKVWLDLGVRKVVVGAETLLAWTGLRTLPERIDRRRLTFSLDIRDGKIVSPCSQLASLSPLEALEHLHSAGWQEVIILDLGRVGSETGVDRALVLEARTHFPDLNLLVGGGISSPEQLTELRNLGVAGVLVATAFHRGLIRAQDIKTSKAQRSQEF